MFGISFEELLVLAVLAFILFGPQKLPEYAAKAGRLVAKLRQASSELSHQVQNPFQYPLEPGPSPAGESTCPYCQQKLGPNFTFCSGCGHRVQEEAISHYPSAPGAPGPEMLAGAAAAVTSPADAAEGAAPPAPSEDYAALENFSIQPLGDADLEAALAIINEAALAYKDVIPADCWQEPYMPREELQAEIAAGVEFWALTDAGRLLGVMGRQNLGPVTLIRHAYVRPEAQQQGVGARLLGQLLQGVTGPVLVGTWAAAWWAVRFYEKHGFKLVTQTEKYRLLQTYWTISPRQMETSVVLAYQAKTP